MMTARRSQAPLLGIVLALLAVFATSLLCTWHCAQYDDDDRIAFVAIAEVHGSSGREMPESPIHIAAHAACQGYVAPVTIAATVTVGLLAFIWPIDKNSFVDGIGVSALLRPPRA